MSSASAMPKSIQDPIQGRDGTIKRAKIQTEALPVTAGQSWEPAVADTHQTGDASDGVVARCQIAEVLVHSLISNRATRKTFELVAATGSAPEDFDQLFAPLAADPPGALDGVQDSPNMPLNDEPQRVRDDLNAMRADKSSPAA